MAKPLFTIHIAQQNHAGRHQVVTQRVDDHLTERAMELDAIRFARFLFFNATSTFQYAMLDELDRLSSPSINETELNTLSEQYTQSSRSH